MKALPAVLVFVAAAALSCGAFAQAPSGSPSSQTNPGGFTMSPGKGRGFVGLSLGRSRYSVACGTTAFNCDNTDNSVQIAAGSMLGNFWGVELAYLDMGRISRGGGSTRAQGLNLSVVGKAPVWQSVGVFGKVGTTYGRTETSSAVSSALQSGTDRGFGLSYGAGVSYDFTPQLSATLAWDSHDFRFAGGGRDPVRSTSLGLQYRY